jgi:hypothetical protein
MVVGNSFDVSQYWSYHGFDIIPLIEVPGSSYRSLTIVTEMNIYT